MPSQTEQSPQLLAELLPAGLYEAPLLSRDPGLVVLGAGEPLRIRFPLEDGYVLDIPVSPDAILGFARLAESLNRGRR